VTTKVLTLASVCAVLLLGGWLVAASTGRPVTLRSRHSDPAIVARPPLVAVTVQGKLYHDPACGFIHGPIHLEPGEEAAAEGYTPCTRCLKGNRKGPSSSER
jgi:hypothetical protein